MHHNASGAAWQLDLTSDNITVIRTITHEKTMYYFKAASTVTFSSRPDRGGEEQGAMVLTDNKTKVDLLNNEAIATTIVDVLLARPDWPVAIGVHGDSGVGKSSILEMIEAGLESKATSSVSSSTAGASKVSHPPSSTPATAARGVSSPPRMCSLPRARLVPCASLSSRHSPHAGCRDFSRNGRRNV